MKVLIINTNDIQGGAAIAANRLLTALNKYGADAEMLVLNKSTDSLHISTINNSATTKRLNYLRFIWERLIIFICNLFSRKNLFQVSLANTGTDISKHPLVQNADIIHLHWINQGFLSLKDIRELLQLNKKVCWTLHDLWPLTGICHYPGTCTLYQELCTDCPMQCKPFLFDLAKFTYKEKQKKYSGAIHFIGCSQWITQMAQKSGINNRFLFTSIPNPIDTTVFYKTGKHQARNCLHLPTDKFLILFIAAKVSDQRKGVSFLTEACHLLKKENPRLAANIEILLIGNAAEELYQAFPFKVHSLGYIKESGQLVTAYNCADIFVIPSLEDNLPNTIMESMACGTPCLGFRTGGIPEMIDHKENGYIASPRDSRDLSEGIEWILTHPDYERLSVNAIEKVRNTYSEKIIAEKYLETYRKPTSR
ncbi:MAG: glycosyltransferase family 4 protein [Tannerellaceae bacterium]|nr:glycosyltransferase family 4 protein [Tannerellaceae bacterium]